ncbi:MAG TPA: ATP-binding protein [Alphaproteobacteria bacterium]|jgi:signal transduction histidine kinase|nr:ATP-binding protein [Alphaproteobacteria bacterium]
MTTSANAPPYAPGAIRSGVENLRVALVYIVAYCLLDWITFIHPFEHLNITPWNPPVATSLFLLLTRGLKWTPLLFVGALTADITVRHLSLPLAPDLITDVIEAVVYGGAVWVMGRLAMDPQLARLRDVVIFLLVTAAAAAVMAVAYVSVFWASGVIPADKVAFLLMKYWIGDTIGAMLAPALLIHASAGFRIRIRREIFTWQSLLPVLSLGAALWALFFIQDPVLGHVLYPMFVPLVWVAATKGIRGTTAFLVVMQVAAITMAEALDIKTMPITQLQVFVLFLSWTGLLLGAVVSEREQARISVVNGEARLRSIMNTSPDAMLIADENGRIEYANRRAGMLFEWFEKSLVGRRLSEVFPRIPGDGSSEMTVQAPDGQALYVEVAKADVTIGGRNTSVLAVRDLTERKKAEWQLRQHKNLIEQVSKDNLTDGLSAVLAHEINQPLSAIVNYSSALQETLAASGNPSPKIMEQLAKISIQAKRAGSVIERLRELSRGAVLKREMTSIRALVDDVLALLGDEIALAQVIVEVNIDPKLVAAVDRVQLEQVAVNLIRNSLEALTEGSRERRIYIDAWLSENRTVAIEISDTGPGIASDVAHTLFEPFVTTRTSGMGLGLSISNSIVEAHGGKLQVNAEWQHGASFRITLPLYIGAAR